MGYGRRRDRSQVRQSAIVSAPAEPPSQSAEPAKPRPRTVLGAGSRDFFISMLILLPIVGLVALLGRGCSFTPGGPSVDSSQLPTIDPHPTLVMVSPRMNFPVREPALPPGWRASAIDLAPAPGGASAVRISWITAGGRYLRLVQTTWRTTDEGALVAAEAGGNSTDAKPIQAGGAQWVDYTGGNGEHAWVRRNGAAQWLITGDGLTSEFTALADAVTAAQPLPH